MARRIRKSPWTRSFQRTLGALGRAAFQRSGRAVAHATAKVFKGALQAALAPAARSDAARLGKGRWSSGAVVGPTGVRRYRLYLPPGAASAAPLALLVPSLSPDAPPALPLPLLVMLHGCDQDATGFARSTRMAAVAARAGFALLLPEQERLANAHGCWNWFDTRSGRAATEAASIVAAVDQACRLHGTDASRVAVAGLSAGASMAGFLALHYPGRFQAVAMHSGIAPGAAHSTVTAFAAMQGRRRPAALTPIAPVASAASAASAASGEPAATGTPLPPLLVIQGNADAIVRPRNGADAARLWARACGAEAGRVRTVQRGARHAMAITDFKRSGQVVVTLCEVAGLGHAWSGGAAGLPYTDPQGPDASRLIWAFVARQFSAVAP